MAPTSLAGLAEPGFLSLSLTPVSHSQVSSHASSSSGAAETSNGAASIVSSTAAEAAAPAVDRAEPVPPRAVHGPREYHDARQARKRARTDDQELAGAMMPFAGIAEHDFLSLAPVSRGKPSRSSRSRSRGGGGKTSKGVATTWATSSSAAAPVAAEPIDAVPLQAVYSRFEILQPSSSRSSGGEETSNGVANTPVISISAALPVTVEPIRAVPLPATFSPSEALRPSRSSGGGETSNTTSATSSSAAAPVAAEPMDAAPLQAVYVLPAAVPGGVEEPNPNEPAWIRAKLLPSLRLRDDLPLHFIDKKRVKDSDLDAQQSRFLIPQGAVNSRLRPLLSAEERQAANLVEEVWKRPAKKEPERLDAHGGGKRPKEKGKKHGGLVVRVIVDRAGRQMELEMTRWGSSGSTVLKLKEFREFVARSDINVNDEVEIWAFRGQPDDPLYLVIAKTDGEQPHLAVPPGPAPNALPPQLHSSSSTSARSVGSL